MLSHCWNSSSKTKLELRENSDRVDGNIRQPCFVFGVRRGVKGQLDEVELLDQVEGG